MSQQTRRLVRCNVGPETYCIENDWLDSIHVIENLYPRRSPDGAVGWIRRFDEKVPVYRLADQLEDTMPSGTPHGVIMVLTHNHRTWALLVDKVSGATEVPSDHVFAMPWVMGPAVSTRFPEVVVDSSDLTLYLAPDRVVPEDVSGKVPPPARRTPPGYLNRRAPAAAPQQGAAKYSSARQIITFTLRHEERLPYTIRFAVSAGQALEIVGEMPMIMVPNSPPFVGALASWRSLPVPVVDLAAWLGMPPAAYRPGCRLLICRATANGSRREGGLIAIPAVEDIRKLDLPITYTKWTEPVNWNASLAHGVYLAERGMLVVPDLDAILSFQNASGYWM